MDFFQTSARNILAAETAAGIGHHVALAAVGTDRLPGSGYFRAKLAQEEPASQAFVEATATPPSLYQLTPAEARKVLDDVQSAPIDKLPVEARWVTVPAEVGDVQVRIVRPPDAEGKLPVILYMHGGGWVLGNSAAAPGPDEGVAAELERSAARARARGGTAAAAAFLQRAAELTGEPLRRSERALAAAQTSLQAGAFDVAAELLNISMAGPLDELQQTRVDLVRGQIAFASSAGGDTPALLVKAAKQLEPLDAALARQTYLDAWYAALFAGQFAGAGSLHDVSWAARSAPPPAGAPRASDLLLDALAVLITEGRVQAAPLLRRVARVFAEEEIAMAERLRWSPVAVVAAVSPPGASSGNCCPTAAATVR
jgi:hypothetical protein